MGDTDRCRKCGNSGHMSGQCNNTIEKAEWLKQLENLSNNYSDNNDLNHLLDSCTKAKQTKAKQPKAKQTKAKQFKAKQFKDEINTNFQCKFCDRVCRSQNGLDKHYEEYCKKIPKGKNRLGINSYNYGEYIYNVDSSEES